MPPTKQYVNLPAKEGQKQLGNKPLLEAVPKGKKGFFEGKRKVLWSLEPLGNGNVDPKYIGSSNRAKLKDPESTEAGGKFTNELRLPHVGKDQYKVKVKKKAKKEKDQAQLHELEFETWRKIYYTVWVMNDECERIFNAVKDRFHAAFEPAGIELEMVEQLRCKADEEWTLMKNSDYDLPWVYPDGTADVEHVPFHLKVVLLNNLREFAARNHCVEAERSRVLTPNPWKADPDFWVVDLDADARPASKGKVKLAALNHPSKLTAEQVTKLKGVKAGDSCGVSDAGKLTKGALDVTAGKTVVHDGSGWRLLGSTSKTVEQANALTPAKGDTLTLSDGGKLTKGDLTVAAGDQVIHDGTKWVKVAASLGTFRVVDVNDPRKKPDGLTDPQLDALIAPANGDAWELEDKGTVSRGNAKVLPGNLVKWDGSKWVVHRGRWELHIKPGHPLGKDATWNQNEVLYLIDGEGGAANFDPAKLEKVSDTELKAKLHEDAKLNDALDRGKSVKVQPKLGLMVDSCCGYSIGNFVVVRIEEEPARLESCILQTFTHEIGHGLQQASKRWKLHDANGSATGAKEANALWHTDDKGGQGPHCAHNAKEIDSNGKTTSGRTFEWDSTKGKLCTLFFRDDANVEEAGKFCPTCVENLRKTNLSEAVMRAQGWDDYP